MDIGVPRPVEIVGVGAITVCVGQVLPDDVIDGCDDRDGSAANEIEGVGVACGISPQCDNDGVQLVDCAVRRPVDAVGVPVIYDSV